MTTPEPLTGATAIGAVIDALYRIANGLTEPGEPLEGVNVGDSWLVTNDTGDYLMIGVEDPDQPGAALSADTAVEWAHVGHQVSDETGEITCAAQSWNGDVDAGVKVARDRAVAIVNALGEALAQNPSIGLPQPAFTRLGSRIELNQAQSPDGPVAQITFRVWFRARLFTAPITS